LAALNYLPPIAAAFLHVVGSLIVVFNSARLVRQGEEMEPHVASPNEQAVPAPLTPTPVNA
jgi:Cd2+/Zn2+-exporting ATPase